MSQVAIVHKFQQLDEGVIECGPQLAFRLEVEIENLSLGNFSVVKDPHDNADEFFDVMHHESSRRTDEQVWTNSAWRAIALLPLAIASVRPPLGVCGALW
jgi:hypothetical protein